MESGSYEEAIAAFEALGDYQDAAEKAGERAERKNHAEREAAYQQAISLMERGSYAEAIAGFGEISDYRDEAERSRTLWPVIRNAPTTLAASIAQTVALRSDGTVVAVGNEEYDQCNVAGWTDIISVSAGMNHTVGLKADGTVVAVGRNDDGQCDVSDWTNIVEVYAGRAHTVGLKSDGTVIAIGYNNKGQCEVSSWSDVVAISAGSVHTLGLYADGSVAVAGYDVFGQCNVSDWTASSCRHNFSKNRLPVAGETPAAGSTLLHDVKREYNLPCRYEDRWKKIGCSGRTVRGASHGKPRADERIDYSI